jgi:hypothetical protein
VKFSTTLLKMGNTAIEVPEDAVAALDATRARRIAKIVDGLKA